MFGTFPAGIAHQEIGFASPAICPARALAGPAAGTPARLHDAGTGSIGGPDPRQTYVLTEEDA